VGKSQYISDGRPHSLPTHAHKGIQKKNTVNLGASTPQEVEAAQVRKDRPKNCLGGNGQRAKKTSCA